MMSTASTARFNGTAGFFEKIDMRFGRFIIEKFVKEDCPEIQYVAALASKLSRAGHSCIPMERGKLAHLLPFIEEELPPSLDISRVAGWPALLLDRSAAVSHQDALAESGPGDRIRPLVVDQQKSLLYLYRYWAYEQKILGCIRDLQKRDAPPAGGGDGALFRKIIEALFPEKGCWRTLAAATASLRRFTVITGGPGTGKTTTVARILALLLIMNPGLSIAIAAPTGKAAARIGEAVSREKMRLAESRVLDGISPAIEGAEIVERIPSGAATIHRMLGPIWGSPSFRHNRENPLPFDVLVIDEASMVDLPLMAKTMDAMKKGSRLILLGDRNQLASVEIGVVFGDICSRKNVDSFSPESAGEIRKFAGIEVTPAMNEGWIEGSIVELKENFRFGAASAIAGLSRAVNGGDGGEVMEVLRAQEGGKEVAWAPGTPGRREELKAKLKDVILKHYGGLFGEKSIGDCFTCLEGFRVLSPLRKGPFGVMSLNRIIEEILDESGLIAGGMGYYRGKPVIVMENDYGLSLYNGDVGVTAPDEKGGMRAWFPGGEGAAAEYRGILPGRLPEHETVYAMTVHKSQGSEFDEVLLILPPGGSPVLTRELLYTAVTRSRKRVEIWGSEEVIRACVAGRVERVSGMGEITDSAG